MIPHLNCFTQHLSADEEVNRIAMMCCLPRKYRRKRHSPTKKCIIDVAPGYTILQPIRCIATYLRIDMHAHTVHVKPGSTAPSIQTSTVYGRVQYTDKHSLRTSTVYRQVQYTDKYGIQTSTVYGQVLSHKPNRPTHRTICELCEGKMPTTRPIN